MHDWDENCPPPWSNDPDRDTLEQQVVTVLERARLMRYRIHFADDEKARPPFKRR